MSLEQNERPRTRYLLSMFDVRQFFLSLVSCLLLQRRDFSAPRQQVAHGNKSVAIVGAGSTGLAMLRALQDEVHDNLDRGLYAQRRDVTGGMWCNPFPLLTW
jgi:NADH dehydrogenase FAD-containing subunit